MDAVLTDTDVFSYLMKPKDTRGDAYRPHVRGKTVAVSFITVVNFTTGRRNGIGLRRVVRISKSG